MGSGGPPGIQHMIPQQQVNCPYLASFGAILQKSTVPAFCLAPSRHISPDACLCFSPLLYSCDSRCVGYITRWPQFAFVVLTFVGDKPLDVYPGGLKGHNII